VRPPSARSAEPGQAQRQSPLQLYEAINAVQIAEPPARLQYAPDILAKAKQELVEMRSVGWEENQRKVMITYASARCRTRKMRRVATLRKMQQEKEQQQQLAMQQRRPGSAAPDEAQTTGAEEGASRCTGSPAEAAAANARVAQVAAEHTPNRHRQTEQMRERLARSWASSADQETAAD